MIKHALFGILWGALSLLLTSCQKADPPQKADPAKQVESRPEQWREFFSEWLKQHGEENLVVDRNGIGVAGNPTRLKASVYGVDSSPKGTSVEVEFQVLLPDHKVVIEFVAGFGDDLEKAKAQAMGNFVLTTFHPLYRAFINPKDEHQGMEVMEMGGIQREVFVGSLIVVGDTEVTGDEMDAVTQAVRGLIVKHPPGDGVHWMKIVYAPRGGKAVVSAVTMDNADHPILTKELENLPWPKRDELYMAKQFIIVK